MARNQIWVKGLHTTILHWTRALFFVMVGSCGPTNAQTAHVESKISISQGLHLWYEIKSDPENSANLIICGTKWDALANGPFGVVYASSDAGKTWQTVLEDRNSAWVTEHSCAFGAHHRAYFISEASKVIDGEPHHELGTTRLFYSTDSGRHWIESARTGWADYSSSAASEKSGELYTFFQATWIARERGRGWGNDLGVLVFSTDGKKVSGPFFTGGLRNRDYRGIYPSNAIALKSGAVLALYYGKRLTAQGWQTDIGAIRATELPNPLLESTVISHPAADASKNCNNLFRGSMAYDSDRNRLFLLYTDGCGDKSHIMLTSSDDEGKTWAESAVIRRRDNSRSQIDNPSVVVRSDGELGLLWSEGAASRRWFFSYIQNHELIEPCVELSHPRRAYDVSNDALWTWVYQPDAPLDEGAIESSSSSITVNTRNLVNSVWRAAGLTQLNDKVVAIWSSESPEGMSLFFAILGGGQSHLKEGGSRDSSAKTNVTNRVSVLYGGSQNFRGQSFDNATGTLRVYISVANRGRESIRAPIKLQVDELNSRFGKISILNATNGLQGVGAIWDISDSLTGDRIPPGSSTNPFCLSFHINMPSEGALTFSGIDLVLLRVRVFTFVNSRSEQQSLPKE